MDKLKDSFFQAYFTMPVPRIIVRTDQAEYPVISVNDTFLLENKTAENLVVNHSIFNLFSLERIGIQGVNILKTALSHAAQNNEQIQIPEIEITSSELNEKTVNWWKIELLPVAEHGKKPEYLIISTRDVTTSVISQKELAEAQRREQMLHEELAATNEELLASNEELSLSISALKLSKENLRQLNNELENRVHHRTKDLLEIQHTLREQHELLQTILNEVPAGICVLKGEEMKLEMANNKLMHYWKRSSDIIGKPLTDIFPEIKNQEFPAKLKEVYHTGKPYSDVDARAEFIIDGIKQVVYRDYSYTPIKSKDGTTHRIVALTIDVTDRTIGRLREQELLDETATINEELSASNEELAATNEELHQFREQQQQLINTLAESESRFRNLIIEAPVAICVLKGSDYILDAINAEGLTILGKHGDIIGKSLKETLSPQEKRPFLDLLKITYRSGEIYYGNEVAASFLHNGILTDGYFNFVFKPTKNEDNIVDGIIIVASRVTDLVIARKEKVSAETKLGLAIEAAQMGSWHIDTQNRKLHYNKALATIFGYELPEPMTYDQAVAQVTDDYKGKLIEEIEKAIANGGAYDITYTQRRFNDDAVIWLRSLGRTNFDEHGNPSIFSGIVMDVTEQKKDEQRKNDFIGMVSHELKTPLTSLNGYAQILHNKAIRDEDSFSANALNKVTDQVKKMTTMINGFLNISRLESGKIYLNKTTFNLDDLIKENIEESEILSSKHPLLFSSCETVTVHADRDKIGSVISNMISNAVKYSAEGKEVEIWCKIEGSDAIISVQDHGIGINQQDIPKLFDRFYRVESENTHLISGFGIGLYLSAEIILHHQGKIWVESIPGQGSTFFFSLPITVQN